MRRFRAAAVAMAVGLWVGCAHQALEPVPAPGRELAVAERGLQALVRVRYRGLDGRGRIRLTMRITPDDAFQLAAADVFGRQLWTFRGTAGESQLLDHRRQEVCRYRGEVVVKSIALGELPVSLLPSVLLGELPFDLPAGVTAGEVERREPGARRWTATLAADGRPERWSLWVDGEPLVWWQRAAEGAILSHRDGAQAIWTVVTEEPFDGSLTPFEEPPGYLPGQCDEPDVS